MSACPAPHSEVRWLRSSHSTGMNNCVEAARFTAAAPADTFARYGPGVTAVRDSKSPGRAPLTFSATAWDSFVGALREHASA
ncbi:DUF397 domain-containing protein [Streptomyces sp. NPDC050504]|uniref:DUF397 domain-containing protein n=1 Tax=Streptomyces sp. NPDC050504 TaxID=3365618 RepID=UPI00378EF3C6